ncbi:MAG: TonB-dependent receptor [Rikenellaceae bacterium]
MNSKVQFCRFYALILSALMLMTLAPMSAQAQAQAHSVQGTVTSAVDNMPLIGVSITIQGRAQTGTITDGDGKYALSGVKSGDILEFSYIGYQSQTVTYSVQTTLNISLDEETEIMDEVIVIGYGTQRKREITGAISSVKGESLTKIGGSDFASALQGQMAGVNVQASSGEPGAGINIQIRGIGSFSSGALSPLYVVDGMPYGGSPNIPSSEIESIEVLKDAASASIYGTRASNGVILITTKRGTEGQMRVEYDAYYGVQSITSGIELMDTKGYLFKYMMSEYQNNAEGSLWYSPLWDNTQGLQYDTDWMEELTVDNAPIQNHALTVSGGRNGLTYNVTANYYNQDGSMIKSSFDRLSLKSNTTFEKNRFSAFVSMGVSMENKENTPWGLAEAAITLNSMNPPLSTSGDSGLALGASPDESASLMNEMQEENDTSGNSFNIYTDLGYKITENWSVHATMGMSRSNSYTRVFNPVYLMYDDEGELSGSSNTISKLSETFTFSTGFNTEFITSYEKTFEGGHALKVFGAASAEYGTYTYRNATQTDFPSNEVTAPSSAMGTATFTGSGSINTLLGFVARAIYNYNDRYILSASVRRDGSSKFGLDKWGTFPSVSAGWGVSEEPYFKNSSIADVMSTFKIRGSWGTAGNQSIDAYSYDTTVITNLDYVLGSGDQNISWSGAAQRGFGNADVKWETSVSRNVGLDLGFLEDALLLTVDYYHTDKRDMLLPVTLSPSSGAPSGDWQYGDVTLNAGNMYNKGIELSLNYRGFIGKDFGYSVMGTFSKNENMVTDTYTDTNYISGGTPVVSRSTDDVTFVKEGYPAGSFFLIENLGTIKTQSQLEEYQKIVSTAQLGDLYLIDQDNDGDIDDDDRVYCGSGTPDWEAGLTVNLNYKNFDMNLQIYGTYGNKVYNGSRLLAYIRQTSKDLLYMWSPENPTSNVPTVRKEIEHNNTRSFNEYYLEDGSYMRLRNIQIGYTFPQSIINTVNISRLRVYLSAQNPLTFTNYTGYDPEIGGDGIFSKGVDSSSYPVTAQYKLGVQLSF